MYVISINFYAVLLKCKQMKFRLKLFFPWESVRQASSKRFFFFFACFLLFIYFIYIILELNFNIYKFSFFDFPSALYTYMIYFNPAITFGIYRAILIRRFHLNVYWACNFTLVLSVHYVNIMPFNLSPIYWIIGKIIEIVCVYRFLLEFLLFCFVFLLFFSPICIYV